MNLYDKGTISILIKAYSGEDTLVKISEIILEIDHYLDEEQEVEVINNLEENHEIKEYFGLTLI